MRQFNIGDYVMSTKTRAVGIFKGYRDGKTKAAVTWNGMDRFRYKQVPIGELVPCIHVQGTGWVPEVRVGDVDRISNIERRIQELEAEKERLLALPQDDFDNGAVITFTKHYSYSNKSYIYAAIKSNGRWYTTGPKSPKAYTWYELLSWLGEDVSSLCWAPYVEPI